MSDKRETEHNVDARTELVTTAPENSDGASIANLDKYLGTTINGRYLIDKELGRGGIGVVYLARDQQLLGKRVVIKVLLEETSTDEWVRNKFRQEIEALTRIDHPGVIGVLDSGQMPDGKPYFVMQFVEGVNLRSVMKAEGMDLERVANIARQLGAALSAAHDKGVFHRDLKPENVMLQVGERDERVRLIDFGIAKVKDSQDGQSTKVPMIAGTFNYMAPEQLTGDPVSAATDTYAFAIIIYEMLTGRRPFVTEAKSASALLLQLLDQQRNGMRLKPHDLRPALDAGVDDLVARALAYEPEQRYQRAQDFGEEIAQLLAASANKRSGGALVNSLSQPVDAAITAHNVAAVTAANQANADTRQAALTAAPPTRIEPPARKWSAGSIIMLIGLVLIIPIVGVAVLTFIGIPDKTMVTGGAQPANNGENAPERQFSYWLTVQKYRDGKPFEAPFQLSHAINFEPGYHVKLHFTSPQSGHLYILNEGPPASGGAPNYWNILFPSPTANNGTSLLNVNGELQIPQQGDGFVFDQDKGTEKLWIFWSAESLPLLEELKRFANEKDRGEIKDNVQTEAVKRLIRENSVTEAKAERDDDVKKQTTVKGRNQVLITTLKLDHY